MTKFAFIPARKGSERIINKNKVLLNGIPLIFYTFAQALSLFNPKSIHVSTNDKEIYKWSKKLGFIDLGLRPEKLSTSTSPDIEWLKYSLKKFNHEDIKVDYVCLLRPTSPFRTKNFIEDGLKKFFKNSKACSLRAIKKCSEHPGKMWILQKQIIYPLLPFSDKNLPWHSMQYKSLPDIYIQTASLEVLNVKKTISKNLLAGEIIVPHFGSDLDNFDINNQSDLEGAKIMISNLENDITKKASILFKKM